jgi:hypothetical protein
VAQVEASGNSPRQNRIIPKVPILSRMLTRSTDVPGVASSAASGSQVCTGNIGALIANAMKNPTNIHRPIPVSTSAMTGASSESRYVGPPSVRDDSMYRPITAASMTSPPSREKIRNLIAAYERRGPPNPPMRK